MSGSERVQATSDEILASTVRIMIYSSIMYVEGHGYLILNGNGYATIKDGRYLVSHNHYNETVFSMLQAGDPDNLLFINVYDAKGGILLQVPAQTVTVALAEGETSVWDFGQVDGVGVFASLGLPSAQFMTGQRLALQPGMEVAQIDWDGHTSYVTWTTIEAAKDVSDIPALKLTSCIRDGASGGGLFWQGIHVGNNWSRSPECDFESAPSSAQYSFVTLNTESVVAPS